MTTKVNISFIYILLVTGIFSAQLFAQTDSTKTTSIFLDTQKEIKSLHLTLIDTTTKKSILDFKPKRIFMGLKPIAHKYFDPTNANKRKTINFMSQTEENDSDILVKRSFLGKDMSTTKKLASHYNLGTIFNDSKSVRIEVRDFGLVDGDRIKVYLNKKIIRSNIMLNGLYYIINIDLKKGYNRIDLEAVNQGYAGPNTAQIKVYDEKGELLTSKEWNILTGQRATLGVVKD